VKLPILIIHESPVHLVFAYTFIKLPLIIFEALHLKRNFQLQSLEVFALRTNHAFGALNSTFSAMNYEEITMKSCKNGNEIAGNAMKSCTFKKSRKDRKTA
jgi:hypothetical protein